MYQSVLHDVVRALEDEAGLDSGVFSALAYLARAEPPGRMRLSELHELMHPRYSQPGLSRLVQRMEADGLVERRPDPDDGRAAVLVLTRPGGPASAGPTRCTPPRSREHFGRHLSAAQARALEAALAPVTRGTREFAAPRSRTVRSWMIKYIGSKRRLVPCSASSRARSAPGRALDLFTGTTRVAQELKRRGMHVTAVDSARYAEVFARCYVETDAAARRHGRRSTPPCAISRPRPGVDGYVTETFCVQSRFFQPFNGRRIDAIRDAIETDYSASPLYPLLLTSLIEAADRVDSTTGVQMAYVKQWAPRSFRPLELRVPELLAGRGRRRARRRVRARRRSSGRSTSPTSIRPTTSTATSPTTTSGRRWSRGTRRVHYGVACKRVDARDPETKSPFNERRRMADALAGVIRDVDAEVIAVSYNDESWVTIERARSDGRGARRRGVHARVRLAALRRRADRHPQSAGPEGRQGVALAQRGVRRGGRRPGSRRERGQSGSRRPTLADSVMMCSTHQAGAAFMSVPRSQ